MAATVFYAQPQRTAPVSILDRHANVWFWNAIRVSEPLVVPTSEFIRF